MIRSLIRRPNRQAVFEPLEGRQLFSGIAFSRHVMTIGGSHNVPNTITFGLNADDTAVVATLSFPGKKGLIQSYTKTVLLSAKINQINVLGGNGADLVTVDQTYGSFTIKTNINVGAGNDTVYGGDEPDRINGAAGNDSLNGGNGNNTIYGGTGNDTLIGGTGADYLNGGVGHDVMYGNDGSDTLADAVGPNTMYGGAGDNTFITAVLSRNVNDYDKTKDKLKIVNPNPADTSTSLLGSLFPITSFL